MKVLNCSKCGPRAVTLDRKKCINISSGFVCNGKIAEIDIIPEAYLQLRFPEVGEYDYQELVDYMASQGWEETQQKTYLKDGDQWTFIQLNRKP